MMTGKRVTLKRGRERKQIIIDITPSGPPGEHSYNGPLDPQPGDRVYSGAGEFWRVAKVEQCQIIARVQFPTIKKRKQASPDV